MNKIPSGFITNLDTCKSLNKPWNNVKFNFVQDYDLIILHRKRSISLRIIISGAMHIRFQQGAWNRQRCKASPPPPVARGRAQSEHVAAVGILFAKRNTPSERQHRSRPLRWTLLYNSWPSLTAFYWTTVFILGCEVNGWCTPTLWLVDWLPLVHAVSTLGRLR